MLDLNDKRSITLEMNHKYPDGVSSEESQATGEIKRCADCGTSKTPLWRGGPAGPKSLCNACGIRSRKRRRAILGIKAEGKKPKKSNNNGGSSSSSSISSSSSTTTSSSNKVGNTLHQRLIEIGREVMMQRSTVENKQRTRKLGEEEQAAVLLMALSYGSVYA